MGYDIQSVDPMDEKPIFIEVKTTNRGRDFPFYVSVNEVETSAVCAERARGY